MGNLGVKENVELSFGSVFQVYEALANRQSRESQSELTDADASMLVGGDRSIMYSMAGQSTSHIRLGST